MAAATASKGLPQTAIVTTITLPTDRAYTVVASFVAYHLVTLRVDVVFLFVDDHATGDSDRARQQLEEIVIAVGGPKRLRVFWRSTALFAELRRICALREVYGGVDPFAAYPDEVHIRQMLHADYVAQLLLTEEDDSWWLVHLDLDELLVLNDDRSTAGEHFARLESCGIEHVQYANHEVRCVSSSSVTCT